jgi:DNA-binding transcriptional LysR family regulator
MTSAAPARAVTPAPVMVGIVGSAPAEMALRTAFAEADRRGVAVRVVVAGTVDDVFLDDLVARWAEKYPGVRVTTQVRRRIDAAVTLVAATRACAVAFVPAAADPVTSAVVRALSRRAHCPVRVVDA